MSNNFHRMSEIFKLYGVEREIPDWIKEMEGYEKDGEETEQATKQTELSPVSDGMIEED